MLVRGCALSKRVRFGEMFCFRNNFSLRATAIAVIWGELLFVCCLRTRQALCVCVCLAGSWALETCGLYETLALLDGCSLLSDSMTFIPHLGLACLMSY